MNLNDIIDLETLTQLQQMSPVDEQTIRNEQINLLNRISEGYGQIIAERISTKIRKALRLLSIVITPYVVLDIKINALRKLIREIGTRDIIDRVHFVEPYTFFSRRDIPILATFITLPITYRHRLLDLLPRPRILRERISNVSTLPLTPQPPPLQQQQSPQQLEPPQPSPLQQQQSPQQSETDFEEDETYYTDITSDKSTLQDVSDSEDININCESSNDDKDARSLSQINKKWIENNCYTCLNPITQYNYTEDEFNDMVSIKQLDSKGKFKRGHCISIKDFKMSIIKDFATSVTRFNPKTIFSIYKLKNSNLSVDDKKRGLGTRPTKDLLFLLNYNIIKIKYTYRKRERE